MTPPLSEQVADAASLMGLLLALDTLFTNEQARRLDAEDKRLGGSDAARKRAVFWTVIALGALTGCALLALWPLMLSLLEAVGGPGWEPVLSVFALVYLLLMGLVGWQVQLARRANRD